MNTVIEVAVLFAVAYLIYTGVKNILEIRRDD